MTVLLRRVVIRNYKSIGECKVELRNLSVLVGPNGAGKSNFIDALRLVSESLGTTLEYAIRQRGGISEVRRKSGGHPNHFAVALRVRLGEKENAHFAFQVGALPEGAFYVQHEQASVSNSGLRSTYYKIRDGEVVQASEDIGSLPKLSPDRRHSGSSGGCSRQLPAGLPWTVHTGFHWSSSESVDPAAECRHPVPR